MTAESVYDSMYVRSDIFLTNPYPLLMVARRFKIVVVKVRFGGRPHVPRPSTQNYTREKIGLNPVSVIIQPITINHTKIPTMHSTNQPFNHLTTKGPDRGNLWMASANSETGHNVLSLAKKSGSTYPESNLTRITDNC